MREMIERFYNEALDELFKDRYPDIKKAIKESDRKPKMIDNLVQQIRTIEKKRTKKMQKDGTFRIHLDRKKIKSLVVDFVKLHGQAVIKFKENEIRTHDDHSKAKIWLPNKGIRKKAMSIKRVRRNRGEQVTKGGLIIPSGIDLNK